MFFQAVDPVSTSSLPSVTTSNTVSNTSAEPSTTPTVSISQPSTSIPNLEKPTAVETRHLAVSPAMLPSQAALLSTQTGLVPPPIPPSFVGIGMPVQFPSAGFGVPQLVGLRTPLQNGPGPLLMAGSGIPTIAYQQQVVGGVPVAGGLPGNTQGLLQPGITGGTAPFAAPQNQMALMENLVTATSAIASSTQVTTTIVQAQAGCALSASDDQENDRASIEPSSPESDSSAPSPEGSPELNLEDVEFSGSESNTSNVNGLQTNQSFLSNIQSEKEIQNSTSAKKPEISSTAQAKDLEAAANLSPAPAQQVS